MNKEEILAKSREENRNRDPYEQETLRLAGLWASLAMVAVVMILQIAHLIVRGELSSGAWAVLTGYHAADWAVRAIRGRKAYPWGAAAFYALMCAACIVLYIQDL